MGFIVHSCSFSRCAFFFAQHREFCACLFSACLLGSVLGMHCTCPGPSMCLPTEREAATLTRIWTGTTNACIGPAVEHVYGHGCARTRAAY